ncbi:MAG: hypothetical protein AAF747_01115 [Planctomycetota bacterium]
MSPVNEHALTQGRMVPQGMKCSACAYLLEGLRFGDPCPECGTVIKAARFQTRGDMLTNVEPGRISRLGFVLSLLLAAQLGHFAATMTALFTGRALFSWLVVLLAGVAWGMVWIAMGPKPPVRDVQRDNDAELPVSRQAARWMYGAWVAGAAAQALALQAGGAMVVDTIGTVLLAVSAAGMVPLCAVLADYADFGRDDGLAGRLRAAAWGAGTWALVLIGGFVQPIVAGFSQGIGSLIGIVMFLLSLVVLVCFFIYFISLLQLCGVVFTARDSAIRAIERDERVAERKARCQRTPTQHFGDKPGEVRDAAPDEYPCPECGYNMLGLPDGMPCPECGQGRASGAGLGRPPPIREPQPVDLSDIALDGEPAEAAETANTPGSGDASGHQIRVESGENDSPYELADDDPLDSQPPPRP